MQTILGSGGIIATELAKVLREKYTSDIRLVARNPKQCNPDDELLPADLTDPKQTNRAIAGSEVAYLTIGLPYKAKVWAQLWPLVMENVIQACREHNCRLVFFDNIYMYDRDYFAELNETTPIRPTSKKGQVRAQIASRLMAAIEANEVSGLIARCADYYGPGVERNSMVNETIVQNYAKGKAAQWLGPVQFKHSFTYTVDAAEATAILGNSPEAFGEVWHLPTKDNPWTAEKWLKIIADYFDVEPKKQLLTPTMASILSLFIPVLKEVKEMMYQYDRDYIFDSSKFEERFSYQPTSYEEGIRTMLAMDYPK